MPTSDLSSEPTRASLADVTPAIALGPLDGRYRSTVAPLVDHLSEAALNRERLHVEVEWLVALTDGTADGPVVDERGDRRAVPAVERSEGDRRGDVREARASASTSRSSGSWPSPTAPLTALWSRARRA